MKKLNVALVGCGYVTIGHFKAWRRIPQANIVAVSDLNENLAKSAAVEWGVPHYYKTLSEIVKEERVDVVDICTPPQAHASLAVEAMTAGINVLIEKPMTMTVRDAEKIVESQKASGVKAGVIHNWLFDLPVLKAREIVKKGELGEVLNAEIEALNTKEDTMAANEHHWSHQLPGGRFSEMLAHPIYLLRDFLQGEVNCTYIEASKAGGYPWMKSDELCATFRVGGKLGRAYASFVSSRDAIYVSLYCTRGILKLDIINSTLNVFPARMTSRLSRGYDSLRQASQLLKWTAINAGKVASRNWYSGHDMYIKLYAESLLANRSPPVTVEDGVEVTRTLEHMCKRIEELESF
jgi:predicted dehydrogenase